MLAAIPSSRRALGVDSHCMWLLCVLVCDLLLHRLCDGKQVLYSPAATLILSAAANLQVVRKPDQDITTRCFAAYV